MPVLLIVAALAVRQIDLYPPTADEFFSMNNAGWLRNSPYSPLDILQSLQQYSPNHTPGYFMLLSAWGRLTAYDVALGRVLTIFTGLLALAVTYRLARDFVAPVAGLFAVIIVASSAFYNFYYAHVRMYPLLVLASGIALWLYLRITHQQKRVKRSDCLALGAAVFPAGQYPCFQRCVSPHARHLSLIHRPQESTLAMGFDSCHRGCTALFAVDYGIDGGRD